MKEERRKVVEYIEEMKMKTKEKGFNDRNNGSNERDDTEKERESSGRIQRIDEDEDRGKRIQR